MYAVNQAINILDNKLEKDICKATEIYKRESSAGEVAGKCGKGGSDASTATGLSALWDTTSSTNKGGNYDKAGTDKMGNHTSATISKDTAALNREQHGVVSSAFAKAHEGV